MFVAAFISLLSACFVSAAPTALPPWATAQYDVIVVGSGPAGVIIASRLSQNLTRKVLLLEGGGPSYYVTGGTERPAWLGGTSLSRVDVPGLYSTIFGTSSPTLMCGSRVNAYQGCTVGGNSAINAGLFFQPPASDFDTYFPAGWKSSDLAPAITRLSQTQPSTNNPSADGVRYLETAYTAAKKWLVTNGGYAETNINGSPNTKSKVFGRTVYDYANGQRGGPVVSYMQTAKSRSNFQLQTGVWVQRVVRSGSQATGVQAVVGGVTTTIGLTAKGRVILSGGALKSPELLMKSAIGDPAVLVKLAAGNQLNGVPSSQWINNTAVGAGLFDNPNTFIELSGPSVQAYSYSYDSPPANDQSLYLTKKSGPYSFAGLTGVFWDYITHSDGTKAGMQGTISSAGYSQYTNSTTITLNIYGTSGLKSTGQVTLDGNFVPGPGGNVYYGNAQDSLDIATFIRKIFDALPGSGLSPLNLAQASTVAQIQTYITTPSAYARGQVNHWSSSCRIGSCVDANAQVVGMKNLHVVDASIVAPLTVNPQMGIMIVAERAFDLIAKLMAA